jgi:hypothetical protein
MATDWLRYTNQGATRSQPLSPRLSNVFGSFLPGMGVSMEVFSGGQPTAAEGGARTGSVRHDHGNAADVFFYKDGRKLDWANPNDRPVFEDIVRQGKAAGLTGFGAGPGYMQPGSMHVGFGTPGVWGAGGSGRNAPDWLTAAYGGAPASKPLPTYDELNGTQAPAIAATSMPGTMMASAASQPSTAPVVNTGNGYVSPTPEAVPESAKRIAGVSAPRRGIADVFSLLAAQQQAPQVQAPPIQGPSPEQAQALLSVLRNLNGRQV